MEIAGINDIKYFNAMNFTHCNKLVFDCLIRLLFEMTQVSILDWDGSEYNAFYDSFVIGSEDKNFPLYVSGYESENSTLDDGFAASGQTGMPFTTYDRDNDNRQNDINCASRFSGGKDRYILTKILPFKMNQT